MAKVKEHDKIILYVKQNPSKSVEAVVTHISHNGTVYFRPLKNLDFDTTPNHTFSTSARLCAGTVYSTAEIDSLSFTGAYKNFIGIALKDSEDFLEFLVETNKGHHKHTMPVFKKTDTELTSKCEEISSDLIELQASTKNAIYIIERDYLEVLFRDMLKAGFTPNEITRETQRQFRNAMVKE
ncbi:hypothetical protein adrianh_86 [Escherichia phage adrianh]|uniref:Uncharacterized protein n=1 Tax=Escherichia phage adrianh TaxID=2696377 RepID=A0A6B9X451_9CAUD|nr:hypothetical protein adrianh_86 [Escherichia phage adrianh]